MTRPYAFALLLALPFSLVAETPWATVEFVPQASRVEGGMTLDRVRDTRGMELEIAHRGDLDASDLARIKQFQDIFSAFKAIKPRIISYVVDGQKVEASYLPESIPWQGTEMRDNLPAGLAFQFGGNIQYDFRLVQTNVFVRIHGLFDGEDALLKKINEAVQNPILYIKRNDPNYFSDRLTQIEEGLNKSAASNEALVKRNDDLRAEVDFARRAALAYITGGLFGPKPVDLKVVEAVVKAKREEPTLTSKAIAERLTKAGIKADGKDISAILQLWFHAFEK